MNLYSIHKLRSKGNKDFETADDDSTYITTSTKGGTESMIPQKSIGRMLDIYMESELRKNKKDLESSLFVDDAVEVEVASSITM